MQPVIAGEHCSNSDYVAARRAFGDCAAPGIPLFTMQGSVRMPKFDLAVSSLLATFLTCLSGCDADVDPVTERTGGACSAWKCGLNAAEVNGRSLQELHLGGLPNAAGVRIVGFTPPALYLLGGNYTLAVEGDELVAKRPGSTLRRQQLVTGIINVQVDGGLVLPVTIAGYSAVPSWAAGGSPIAAYTLLYPELGELLLRNVCSGSLLDPLASQVTVLGGETYDGVTKKVNAGMTGWFTLACAGSAAAKLKLLGYGPQSNFPGASAPASVAARQATLKMITGDYCGAGHSYTANGTAVVWQNREGTVDSSDEHTPGEVEAVWDQDGALCLEGTRLADADVDCELPSCDGLDLADGAWITHVVQ